MSAISVGIFAIDMVKDSESSDFASSVMFTESVPLLFADFYDAIVIGKQTSA